MGESLGTQLGSPYASKMKDRQDAYGHEVYDCLRGVGAYEIVERDDGYIDAHPAGHYLAPFEVWAVGEREAMSYVRGQVLDIGCGAGRHALYLEERGFDVVAIDVSPLAVEVRRQRNVRNVSVMSINAVSAELGQLDTILMMGANFGLFGNERRANRLLKRFRPLTSPDARTIASARDPYRTENPFHLEYHQRNRERGRMGGQLRLRVRYQKYVTRWFDYLFVSPDEMKHLLEGTGWAIRS